MIKAARCSLFFFVLLSACGSFASEAVLKNISDMEVAVSELKLKQFIQRIGWPAERQKSADEALEKSSEFRKARDEFFNISARAAAAKRALELEKAAGRKALAGAKAEFEAMELELRLKKAAYELEKVRLQHYQQENSSSGYLNAAEAFDDFNKARNEYFSQLESWVLFAATENILRNYFDFGKFRQNILQELKSLFITEIAAKAKVTAQIGSYFWDEYVELSADFEAMFRHFESAALARAKEELKNELGKKIGGRERKKIALTLENDQEIINMARDAKRSVVKNLIHEKLKEELLTARSDALKLVAKKMGGDFGRAYPNTAQMLADYRKNTAPLPFESIIEKEILPEEAEYVGSIKDLLDKLSVLRRQKLNDPAALNRYYMWGDMSGWPLNGIKVLQEALKAASASVRPDEMDMIAQLSNDIVMNKMYFDKYSGYYFRVMDTGGGFDAPSQAGRSAPYAQETDVLNKSAYSYAQAKKLYRKFQKLKNDFENYYRQIENLAATAGGGSALAAAQKKKMDEINGEYFLGGGAVDKVFYRMNESFRRYGITEADLLQKSRGMPDGLDPVFAPKVRGINR